MVGLRASAAALKIGPADCAGSVVAAVCVGEALDAPIVLRVAIRVAAVVGAVGVRQASDALVGGRTIRRVGRAVAVAEAGHADATRGRAVRSTVGGGAVRVRRALGGAPIGEGVARHSARAIACRQALNAHAVRPTVGTAAEIAAVRVARALDTGVRRRVAVGSRRGTIAVAQALHAHAAVAVGRGLRAIPRRSAGRRGRSTGSGARTARAGRSTPVVRAGVGAGSTAGEREEQDGDQAGSGRVQTSKSKHEHLEDGWRTDVAAVIQWVPAARRFRQVFPGCARPNASIFRRHCIRAVADRVSSPATADGLASTLTLGSPVAPPSRAPRSPNPSPRQIRSPTDGDIRAVQDSR